LPARQLGGRLALVALLLSGVVRRDRERSEPDPSDSPSAKMPRITGRRAMTCRFIGDSMLRETWAMSPSGLRTATDQFEGPRIMTPSRTA
jgi:hypothetical protein